MLFIDTHCHLDLPDFKDDLETVIQRSLQKNVKKFVLAGVYEAVWDRMLEVCQKYSECYAAPGFHPCYISHHSPKNLERLRDVIQVHHKKIIALGETGLDLFIENPALKTQLDYFQGQIEIAKEFKLPLLLHVRKAHDQAIKQLKEKRFEQQGIIHCYSGSLQQAKKYLDLGFKLGIGGVITYDRSKRLQKIVRELPLESFVLETDAPDIPIFGQQNRRNSPEFIPDIFQALCRYRNESAEIIQHHILENSYQIFPKLRD